MTGSSVSSKNQTMLRNIYVATFTNFSLKTIQRSYNFRLFNNIFVVRLLLFLFFVSQQDSVSDIVFQKIFFLSPEDKELI